MHYAIITPSYAPDFERCQLLVQSVKRYARGNWSHHVIVDRKDESLFTPLQGERTHLAIKEDWMPWWIRRSPFSRRWWLSLKSLPVRGWIVQQLIKVAVGEHIDADAYIFVDSDLAFVRPFEVSMFERNGKLRLFRVVHGNRTRWHRTAEHLLGLPEQPGFRTNYIGALVTWRRDHLVQMYEHIHQVTGWSWFLSVAQQLHFAEYILYGTFVDRVLQEDHQHYYDDSDLVLISWEHEIKQQADLEPFFSALQPGHIAMMLSSNLGIPASDYRELIPFQDAS